MKEKFEVNCYTRIFINHEVMREKFVTNFRYQINNQKIFEADMLIFVYYFYEIFI